jgi:hypothetical protein
MYAMRYAINKRTKDQIANVRWVMERTRERNKPVYLCFIDYAKAFDSVEHSKMRNSMINMGIPEHLIGVIRDLYTEQEAKVQVEQGTADWFPVQKGIRQGCILSPGLFNLYSEHIISTAGLEDIEAGVKIGGRKINNLRYADDTTLLAENKDDMVQLIKRVKISSEKAGLKLNIKKTRVMSIGEQGNILVDGEEIRTVTSYKFLGALITNNGYIHDEIKKRITLGKAAMTKLTTIMKVSGVSTNTKVKLVQTIVFPAVLYGCESWTLMKADKRKLDAFELWTWIRLLRTPWTARRSNASVIKQIKPRHSQETLAVIGKLKYFGHIMHTSDSLEKDLMLGLTDGSRRRGRQQTKWTDKIRRTMTMNWHDTINATLNRTQWRD